MKSYLLKIVICLSVTGMFLSATAQQAQTTAPKTSAEKIRDSQIKKASVLIDNISSIVKLSDEQKTKLQSSLLESVIKSDEARALVKGDDTKLQAWREAKVADITARIKAILTSEQFDKVMKTSSGK